MKKTLFIFLLLLGIKAFCQSSFSAQVKNKELKAQILAQEKISEQILEILNTDNKVEKYIDELASKEADAFRAEQGLAKDSPIQMSRPRLTHQDSVKLNLINQDDLLYSKFEEYSKIYQYIEKLSKTDKMLREKFYDENIKLIDDKYKVFYQNKRKNKTQFEKLALNTINFRPPVLTTCKDETDIPKCFSSTFRREIERQYNIQEYIYYDTNIIKAKVLFKITKDGMYEPLEISESTNTFFLDMNAIQIARSLFNDKKIALPSEEDYYTKIPLSFSFEGGRN